MAEEFRVQVQGATDIAQRFDRFPEHLTVVLEANFRTLGNETAYVMRQQLQEKYYTGELADSITINYQGGPEPSVAIGPEARHGLFVWGGTRAHWAPIEPLKAWAAARFGDARMAYPIQSKIAREGTPGYDFIEMTLTDGRFQTALQSTAERVGTELVAKLERD